jgi:hypothetical protein
MEFNHEFDGDIIPQLFSTVHIQIDNQCTLTWMTRNQLLIGTWAEFGECLGYPVVEDHVEHGLFFVHLKHRPMMKDELG